MGGYASAQGELREGQIALLLGLVLLWGQQGQSGVGGRWGRAGRIQGGSAVGDGGKETDGEQGRGSPWSREIRQEMWFCPPPPGEERDCWKQDWEPGRRVLRCARREMGAGPWGASGGVARG